MAQSASVELLRRGQKVRVNTVAPGFTKTELLGDGMSHAEEAAPEYFLDPICEFCIC